MFLFVEIINHQEVLMRESGYEPQLKLSAILR